MSRASDQAYHQIRAQIISGTLGPGVPLREEQLAESCGVSRTPVREALRRLESENYVRRNAAKRSFVADWSMDAIVESFALRGLLEGHAAERAAQRISEDQLHQLREHNRAIHAAISRPESDVPRFLDENRGFHAVIVEAAGSPPLSSALAGIVEQPVVLRTALHYSRDELLRSWREHAELIAAFERGDSIWARAVMTGHIQRARHAYADAFAQRRDG